MTTTVLEVKSISKSNDTATVLSGVSFSQQSHQKIAIAGETGSGKSTLLKVIAGLIQPDSGSVYWNGQTVKGPDERLVPGEPGIAFLSQHFELPRSLRVEQILDYAAQVSPQAARKIIKVCRIAHVVSRRSDALSGGERQRVALAQSLLQSPKLLLLDEPYSHLDNIHKHLLKTVVHDISEKLKITIILVAHDPADVLSWANWIVVLRKGKIVQQGSGVEIYEQPKNEYVAGLMGKYTLLSSEAARSFIHSISWGPARRNVLIRPWGFIRCTPSEGAACEVLQSVFCGGFYETELVFQEQKIIFHSTTPLVPGEKIFLRVRDEHYSMI